jgi:hypothetical protein
VRLAFACVLYRGAPVLLSVLATAMLSGCGTISQKFSEAASQVPGIALPADAPERTSERAAYPAVHDLPPPRNIETLTAVERADAERELREARTQQQTSNAAILAESADRDKKEQQMKDLRAAQAAAAAQAGR